MNGRTREDVLVEVEDLKVQFKLKKQNIFTSKQHTVWCFWRDTKWQCFQGEL